MDQTSLFTAHTSGWLLVNLPCLSERWKNGGDEGSYTPTFSVSNSCNNTYKVNLVLYANSISTLIFISYLSYLEVKKVKVKNSSA